MKVTTGIVALLVSATLSGCSINEYHGTTSFECIGGPDAPMHKDKGMRTEDKSSHPNTKRNRYIVTLVDPAAVKLWWVDYPPRLTPRGSLAKVYVNGVFYGTTKFNSYFGLGYELYGFWGDNPEHFGTFYADRRLLELAPENGPVGTVSESASCILHYTE